MNTLTMKAAVTGLASVALAGGALLATPTAQAGEAGDVGAQDYAGCATGSACLYPDASWNGSRPEHSYFSYGAHNFSDEHGVHRVFNNQSDGAGIRLCRGYDGTSCDGVLPANNYIDVDMTKYNSILLLRP